MQPLFNLGEMTEVRPDKEEYTYLIPKILKRYWAPYRYTVFEIHTGNSIEKFRASLSSKTCLEGNYGFYSGALEVGFSKSSLRITRMKYTKIMQLITRWIIQLPDPNDLKELLISEVKEDIDGNLDPAVLFDKYGTHYLWNLIVGGRVSYTSATNSERYKSTTAVIVAAEMSYQSAAGSISASNQTKYGESIDSFNQASQIKARARGGKAAYISAIKTSGISQENWEAWASSVEDCPEFVGYVDNKRQPSLRPIWELCSDKDRFSKLETAYKEYAEKQPRLIQVNLSPVFKHSATNPVRFTLSLTRDPEQAHGIGWSQGDAIINAYKEEAIGTIPIYQHYAEKPTRFAYSPWEDFARDQGWQKDCVAFYAFDEQEDGTIPIYQAHAENPWRFAYSTVDVGEEAHGTGWVNDGPAFFAYELEP